MLPLQGAGVQSLVWEDPTCLKVKKRKKFHLDIPAELSSRQKEQSFEKVQTWDHMCTQRPVETVDVA